MLLLVMVFITTIETLRQCFICVCHYIYVHECIHVEARIEVQCLSYSTLYVLGQGLFLFLGLELIN